MPTQKKTEHADFASAIAAAQADMTNAVKDSKTPHFKSNYSSLSAVRDIVVPAFNKHGIAVLQPVDGADGFMTGRTLLMWKDQTLEMGNCTLPIGNSRNAAQAVGSAATYLARYQLRGVGGIAVEDDDGENYKAPQRPQRQQRPVAAPKAEKPGPKPEKGPNCPKCGSVLNIDTNYRAWFKIQENLPDSVKNRPGLWCSNWKNCDYKEWSTDDAQQALQKLATFDDGLEKNNV